MWIGIQEEMDDCYQEKTLWGSIILPTNFWKTCFSQKQKEGSRISYRSEAELFNGALRYC